MCAPSTQECISGLIAAKTAELGSVGAALEFVRRYLLDTPPPDVADLFPHRCARPPAGRLVRCRGMVQEADPGVSLYRAAPGDPFGAGGARLLEATRLYVIPVPGAPHLYGAAPPGAGRKRAERSEAPGAEAEAEAALPPLYARLNHPHPPRAAELAAACVVTVVHHEGEEQGTRPGLNDVVEFVGFLSDAPVGSDHTDELDMLDEFGAWHAEELPMGCLTHMTCVAWRHLFDAPKMLQPCSYFESNRPLVVQHLTNTLCQGDALLAEYLLLHLSARVIAHASATPVGDLPLCVRANTEINVAGWSSFLRRVVPVGEILFDTELFSRRDIRFAPCQDHERNILQTGVLQVANGTHITMDASAVAFANAKGGALHDALFAAIHKQVLLLEYPYQVQELPVDLSFLALSTGELAEAAALLRFAVTLEWTPQRPTPAAVFPVLKDEEVRDYLTAVRRVKRTFDTDPERTTRLAESLVSFAKAEPTWNNGDSLIHNNSFSSATSLMRAYAASLGRDTITDEDVTYILELERCRVTRSL